VRGGSETAESGLRDTARQVEEGLREALRIRERAELAAGR
jgi:hypothetical protein